MVRPDMRRYQLLDFLIEFKYIKLKELGLTAQQVQQVSDEALNKVNLFFSEKNHSLYSLKLYTDLLFFYSKMILTTS